MQTKLALLSALLILSCNRHDPLPAAMSSSRAATHAPSRRQAHDWMARQRGFPGGVPVGAEARARQQWADFEAAHAARLATRRASDPTPRAGNAALGWTQIGPGPIRSTGSQTPNMGSVSGRVGAIAVDPTNAQIIYLGESAGGVWKSSDGGTTWMPTSDAYPLPIGTLLIDPANHLTIWAGTGEGDSSADSLAGAGVLKSTDGGATWTQYAADTFAGASFTDMKLDGTTLYATLNTGNDGDTACAFPTGTTKTGFYKSTDGGQSWTQLLTGTYSSFVVVAPQTFLLASPYTGVYKWKDQVGGAAPALLALTPSVANIAGLRLAAAPSAAGTVYLGVGAGAGQGSTSGTLYVSTNATATTPTFAALTGVPNFCETQCDYDLLVAVDPNDDKTVYLGGSLCAIWKGTAVQSNSPSWSSVTVTVDQNNTPITVNDQTSCDNNWFNGVVHSDVHALVVDPTGNKVYVGDDGGFATSANAGAAWTTPDQGLATGLFHGLCIDPVTHKVWGGLQDNGTNVQIDNGLTWQGVGSGDGGRCIARSSAGGGAVMVEVQQGAVSATTDAFATISTQPFTNPGDPIDFVAPLAGDTLQPMVAYLATNRLWRTTDFGATSTSFQPITALGSLTTPANANNTCGATDYVTAIAVAPTSSDAIYTGSSEGVLKRVTQAGVITSLTSNILPPRWVSDIAVDPHDDKIVYVAFSGFGSNSPGTPGHIFKSIDAGVTWARADGALPDSPVSSLLAHPKQSGRLWAGTDFGVVESLDGGTTWNPIGSGMPKLPVTALAFDAALNTLVAGTYGRSAWKLPIPPPAILTLTPAEGIPDGGTSVTIMGSGFAGGAIVSFGGTAATVVSVSDSMIAVTTPAHAAGAVDVVVTNPDAQTVTATGAFNYRLPVVDMAQPLDMTVPPDLAEVAQRPDMAKAGGGKKPGGCGCELGGALPPIPAVQLFAVALLLGWMRRRARR